MDIIVNGRASKFFKPDMVILNLNFYTKTQSYESAIREGVLNVEEFFKVVEKLKFNKDDIKTKTFMVREEIRYDVEKKKNVFDGFSYSQTAILKFDYDEKLMASFIEEVSKMQNPPIYRINFDIKNKEKAKSLVIADAFAKAEEKAKMIALASGKKLKDCVKVDFKSFEERVISNSNIDTFKRTSSMQMEESISNVMQNVFTPEDIEISESLYCLWITE